MFKHDNGCNIYCNGNMHGIMALIDPLDTVEHLQECVELRGLIFLSARIALEVNLILLKKRVKIRVDVRTKTITKENWPDKEPAVAWLVMVREREKCRNGAGGIRDSEVFEGEKQKKK